jgi:hypothetical protein
MFTVVLEPDDDVDFVVYDEVVERRRTSPAAVSLILVVFVVLLVALVSTGSKPSSGARTYAAIRMAPGRTVGDDKSLAEVHAGKRVLRALKTNGVVARGAHLKSSCTSTHTHDLGGGQSWDCDVLARHSETARRMHFVVHVREDGDGSYETELERG